MISSDIPEVAALERECFSEPWSEKGFSDALREENIFLVARDGYVLAGYIGMYAAAGEGEITNVAVRGDMRRSGIGQALIGELKGCAKAAGVKSIFLEVRASNKAAIGLYKKNGFSEAGVRKGFYRFPPEDAIVMKEDLNA